MKIADSGRRLVVPVFLLTAVAMIAVIGLLWAAVAGINNEQRSIEARLALNLVQSQRDDLITLALDYTWWDEAIKKLVLAPDVAWADDMIGSYMTDTYGVTASYVLSVSDEILVAFEDGLATDPDMPENLLGQIGGLIDKARAGHFDPPEPAAGYGLVNDQLTAVAVGAFTWEDPEEASQQSERAVLVLVQAFDEQTVGALGEKFALDDLAFSPGPPQVDGAAIPIVGTGGSPIGELTWTSMAPGIALLRNLGPAIAIFLALVVAILFLFLRNAGALIASHDSLERAVAREAEVNTLKSRFASMVSHELRTPLSAIAAASGLMRRYRDRLSAEEVDQELLAIEQGVADLSGMTEKFLMLGRLEEGTYDGRVETVKVRELCTEVWGVVFRSLKASHSMNLTFETDDESFETDASLLRTVVTNLFHNAVKFSPGKDHVDVHVSINLKSCEISVRDFGIGIEAADAASFYEPFHRGRNADGYSGSGLGLAIVRATVQQLGGQVWHDMNDGEGASFHVRIPAK